MNRVIKIPKRLLILGNGFDLDLERKTKFSDFVNSSFWPKSLSSGLFQFLNEKAHIEKWFDLEAELANYVNKMNNEPSAFRSTIPLRALKDEEDFSVIVKSMIAYLKHAEEHIINEKSMAATIFDLVCMNPTFAKIYSFNYTDLSVVAKMLSAVRLPEVEYVHGRLLDESAILGINDSVDTIDGNYDFLRKSFNPHYASHPIAFDIKDADEIVFFGHSLGDNDYHYFRSFFRCQCDENLKKEDKRTITIFTKNSSSRIEILRTIHRMNDGNTSQLFQNNQVNIFCVDDGETDAFNKWFTNRAKEISPFKSAQIYSRSYEY